MHFDTIIAKLATASAAAGQTWPAATCANTLASPGIVSQQWISVLPEACGVYVQHYTDKPAGRERAK
jgi:hypothetical protein